jgi:general stress protein YciG
MANSQGDNEQGLGGTDRERGRDVVTDGASARSASSRRSNRGFASMDREKQKEIASKGGRAAHAKGTAHEFDSGEAREAGRKGGMAVSRNREHMAMIGRKGGEARGAKNAARLAAQNGQSASRAAAQQNSGAQALRGDRQVNIPGVAQNTSGASDTSFGGERRGGTIGESSREQRPESH